MTRISQIGLADKIGEKTMTRTLLLATAFVWGLAFVTAGCAPDVVDIDRTQPNKVSKEIFEGEWYFRAVVLDVQYNQGMLFEGLEGDVDRTGNVARGVFGGASHVEDDGCGSRLLPGVEGRHAHGGHFGEGRGREHEAQTEEQDCARHHKGGSFRVS